MLARGQKKRAKALGDLWECASGALAEARGKPTDSVLGKRKPPKAGQAVQLPLCEAPRTAPPLGASTGSSSGRLDPCCSSASWLGLKKFLFRSAVEHLTSMLSSSWVEHLGWWR